MENNTQSLEPLSDPQEVFQYLYSDKIIDLFFSLKELTKDTTILYKLRDSDQLSDFILSQISLIPFENYLDDYSDSDDDKID